MRMTREEHRAAAQLILNQLGGNQFVVMTGAKNFVVLDDTARGGIQFKFELCQKANTLIIKVDDWDTYTVQFWKIGKKTCKLTKEYERVYNDMLPEIFRSYTRLETSLGI